MKLKNSKILWKDRKRFLGMPLSFTRYSLTEDRLFLSVGFFNIRDEDRLAINYFIYENIEGNDLMDFLFDICRLSKLEISGDVVLCLRLVEGDLLYENLLGIYIQIDICGLDDFEVFECKLHERHARSVFYKTSILMH